MHHPEGYPWPNTPRHYVTVRPQSSYTTGHHGLPPPSTKAGLAWLPQRDNARMLPGKEYEGMVTQVRTCIGSHITSPFMCKPRREGHKEPNTH